MKAERSFLRKIIVTLGFAFIISLIYLDSSFVPRSASISLLPGDVSNQQEKINALKPSLEINSLESSTAIDIPHVVQAHSEDVSIPIDEKKTTIREHTFKKGDSFYNTLSNFGIEDQEIFKLAKISKPVYDLRRVRPGQKIKISLQGSPNRIETLSYEIDLNRFLIIKHSEGQLIAIEEEIPFEREIVTRIGKITDTLYESAQRTGVPINVILNLSDIFAWDLDFGTDIRSGDQFNLVFEIFKKEGKTVRSGRILAASMVNRGKDYRAYYFAPEGKRGDYYDEKGRSVRKAFLRSPLRYRYISSGYAKRRLHPILKVNRPHLGIDFAAPRGTPVRAAADGIVSFVGWKGGHGKTVIIRHRNGYKTLYGHLSSFWRGIKKGKRVKQEDFIGRVGSTGLSTGPHLHYTLIKKGRAINPRKADVLRGEPLPNKWHSLFSKQVDLMNQSLDPLPEPLTANGTT